MKKKFVSPQLSIIPIQCGTIMAGSEANTTEGLVDGGIIGSPSSARPMGEIPAFVINED